MPITVSVADYSSSGAISAQSEATLSFEGDSVALLGYTGPGEALVTVQLDNATPMTLNTSRAAANVQVMLFYADGLGTGQHTLRMTPEAGSSSDVLMAVDYAVITAASYVFLVFSDSAGSELITSQLTCQLNLPSFKVKLCCIF